MRENNNGLRKQGFVSIPSCNILLPIYNDAYSEKGLNSGANYVNRSSTDPKGVNVPVMGEGNYGLAAHNFNDGITGFSALQQEINTDFPYLENGIMKGSDWLNGKLALLANEKGIYTYYISGQKLVKPDNVAILDPTEKKQLTIISCLFPSTNYRIVTTVEYKQSYTWENAPQNLVDEFNLKVKKTNAHVSWFNPGTEEGSNGDKGGLK